MPDSHAAGILNQAYSTSGTLLLKQQDRAVTVDWNLTLESHGMHPMSSRPFCVTLLPLINN